MSRNEKETDRKKERKKERKKPRSKEAKRVMPAVKDVLGVFRVWGEGELELWRAHWPSAPAIAHMPTGNGM